MAKIFKTFFVLLSLCIIINLFASDTLFAEYKSDTPSGQNIPKLPVTADDPKLINGHVYPNWGPICQRYTYSVIYQDAKGRPPEYVKIYFNGSMIDMDPVFDKSSVGNEDYQNGLRYEYKNVPNKLGSNFYFFEASNGLGKARSNIIDSPDNGPVLFKSAFEKNEIAVIDINKQTKILSYDVKDEWVGGIALSDDGRYLAAKTHKKIYLFDTSKPQTPVWIYEGAGESPGDVKGGVDISGDGSRIIASIGGKAILFNNQSNKPLWIYKGSGNQAYNVAISKDGKYMAMGTAGSVSSTAEGYKSSETTNLLIFWSEKSEVPLWQYHTEGNFHDVSLSDDGSFVTGATGCPDRRFYLFSKDSNKPVIRSEMLTRDSPVHRAKVSGDGQYAAVGSESGDGAVFLFSKNSGSPVWKFSTPDSSSVRALGFTSDGAHIGAATFKGDVYIFGRNSSTPISHWRVNASLGGVDISEDGSLIAAGGTDNKLHIFKKNSAELFNIDFNEYVEEVDISANGKYVAAGTGGSVYFFEAFDDSTQVVDCKEVKEPQAENINRGQGNIKIDNIPNNTVKKIPLLVILFGSGFISSLIFIIGYLLFIKFKTSPTEIKLNKKIIIIAAIVGAIFLLLTVFFALDKDNDEKILMPDQQKEAGCGNSLCEPDSGESKSNCPQDCLGGD